MFSKRVPPDLRPNSIARALAATGRVAYDLTVSNPTRCGLDYPETLLRPLADREGLTYRPDPLGLRSARETVAGEYRRRGAAIDAERVVLTASTSEAYSYLFKLLCDPGDTVLIPAPSYPLFEHLARLEGVRSRSYALDPDGDWQPGPIDPGTDRARALIVVHPNNPTGSLVHTGGANVLAQRCASDEIALVADEVFFDYRYDNGSERLSFAGRDDVLTFTMGGLSKSLGLPQLKLSWIVVSGPEDQVQVAVERLSFIADNYLTVGSPVQLALPSLFRDASPVHSVILDRCRQNLQTLIGEVTNVSAISVIEPEGGWNACLRFPAVVDEETLALELLEDQVAIHPGYFFDFPTEGYLVLSLLPPPGTFVSGVRRLLRRLSSHL